MFYRMLALSIMFGIAALWGFTGLFVAIGICGAYHIAHRLITGEWLESVD